MIGGFLLRLLGRAAADRAARAVAFQRAARVGFGLMGLGLGAAGAIHVAGRGDISNPALRASAVALFVAVGCIAAFNVVLGRRGAWGVALFALALVALFVSRIAGGP